MCVQSWWNHYCLVLHYFWPYVTLEHVEGQTEFCSRYYVKGLNDCTAKILGIWNLSIYVDILILDEKSYALVSPSTTLTLQPSGPDRYAETSLSCMDLFAMLLELCTECDQVMSIRFERVSVDNCTVCPL